MYQERIRQIDIQLNEVRNGRSQEYLEPLKRLNDNVQSRVEVASILKKCRLENINHKFLAEEQASLQHFEVGFGGRSISVNRFDPILPFRVKKRWPKT